MTGLPWFRAYSRMIDDDKLRLLAFEDRWHFVALCCLKCEALLDEPDTDIRRRRIAVRLGVQVRELEEIGRRLQEVGLVDDALNPVAWDRLQFKTDKSTERVREWRKRKQKQSGNNVKRCSNVSVTAQDTDTDTDTEKDNTPKAPKGVSKPDDVSDAVWQDFKRHRQRHGGISDRVIAGFRREAERAGWTLEQAMDESITQGWRGFKADYVKGRVYGKSGDDRKDGVAKALDRRLGLGQPAGAAGRYDDEGPASGGLFASPRLADLR